MKGQTIKLQHTDPLLSDTDGDGLWDGWNDANGDHDYDAGEEKGELGEFDSPHPGRAWSQGGTSPVAEDTDGDGMWDKYEIGAQLGGHDPTTVNHRYAVLIGGGHNIEENFAGFWNGIVNMYDNLVGDYGYNDDDWSGFDPHTDNIAVLYTNGYNPTDQGDNKNMNQANYSNAIATNKQIIDLPATRSNINNVFEKLGDVMTDDDFLFVFVSCHGDTFGTDSSAFYVWDGDNSEISGDRFEDDVNQIFNYNRMIFLILSCHSGGFINNLHGDDRIVITPCKRDELSIGGIYSLFLCEFLRALNPSSDAKYIFRDDDYEKIMQGEAGYRTNGRDASTDDPNPNDLNEPYNKNADYDSNHYVSVKEAFYWGKWNEYYYYHMDYEHPQYSDDGNIGGDTYF